MKEITLKGPKAITKKRFTGFVALSVTALLLSGCASEAPVQEEHVLRIGTTTEVTNWTPLNSFSTSDYWVLGELYPELFLLNPEGELLPHLLTSFEVSEDAKLVTLKLDERFRWSDGEPITSEDIAFTLDRFVSDKLLSGSSVAWNYQESIIISPSEIKVVSKHPSFGWALDLVQSISILPKHVFSGVDDLSQYSLEQHPESWVSGGSITLSEIVPGQRYSFVPNPYYPLRAAGNEKITEFEYVIYPDLNAMQLALQSGNLDLIAPSLPPAAAKAIDGSNGVTVETVQNALNYSKLSFNASRDALSAVEVRRAIMGLIDTEALNTAVMQGYGKSLVGPILPSYQAKYQPNIEPIHSTVQETKRVLADAGLSGLSLELICDSGNANHVKYAGLVKEALAAADITVKVNCVERSTSLSRAKAGDFDLYIHKLGQAWSPGSNLVQQYHPDNPSGLYYNYVDDREMAALLDAVDAQVAEGDYILAVKAAAKYIHEQAYVLPLYVEALNSAYSVARFHGFFATGMETSTMLNPYSLAQVVPQ